MLYPIENSFRSILDISGIWKFKIDKKKIGEKENWFNHLNTNIDIAVPGSWNEQLEELGYLDYVGIAWYEKSIFIPEHFRGKKIWLRVGSADFFSKVWVNGKYLGENTTGFLPFEFEITNNVTPGEQARVTFSISNELNNETIPQGITSEQYQNEGRRREETYPPARFDFFPFGGIHRPVVLYTTPSDHFESIKILTKLNGNSGEVNLNVNTSGELNGLVKASLFYGNELILTSNKSQTKATELNLSVPEPKLWSTKSPQLYKLNLLLEKNGVKIDEYNLDIGIREIKISGNKLLLNGEEIYLKGFGKHEDFWVIGRGYMPSLMVKDFQLMKWINANSFRTSHYPYAEEIMNYADKKGFLIIDEVPAVSLDIKYANEKTLNNHKEFLKKLVERDFNHPSVIMWAAGNEPNLVGDENYFNGSGRNYWKQIFEYLRSLDNSRPVTVPNCQRAGINDPVFEFSDIISINRYYGWYENPGNIEAAVKELEKEIEAIFKQYNKPILMTEFGADTLTGLHSTSDQMFTEEYQSKLVSKYIELLRTKDYSIGEHVWNFADFRTPMHFRRVVLNLKGIFTRERMPKSAAFMLKEIWE